MATAYTSLLGLALPVTGELDGTWGDTVNNSITQLVEDSVAGTATASVASGDWTLTTTGSGAANQARCAILIPTGTPGTTRNIIAPSQSKAYIVVNQSDGAVVVKGSATTGTTIPAGAKAVVAWNGSDFVTVATQGGAIEATQVDILAQGDLRLQDAAGGQYAAIQAPATISASYTLTLPTTDGDAGQFLQTDGSGVLTWAAGAAGDVTAAGNNAFTGANTFYNSTGQTFGTGTSTQDGIVLAGRAGGSSSYRVTMTPDTLLGSRTVTLPDGGGNYTLGYKNIPYVTDKTSSYQLALADVGKVVGVGTGGSITIPNSVFGSGDSVLVFNNTAGDITITCTITTAYIAGTDEDKASVTLATRGVANILFISGTACVITGNVS